MDMKRWLGAGIKYAIINRLINKIESWFLKVWNERRNLSFLHLNHYKLIQTRNSVVCPHHHKYQIKQIKNINYTYFA
jgi:hypothetical protein